MNDKQPLSARYPDLLNGQDDPDLLKLVEDLDALYTSHTLPARLARPVEKDLITDVESSPLPLPAQSGTLASSAPRRHTRWLRPSALAAVLCTALLVGALAGTFALAHRDVGTARQGTASSAVVCRVAHPSPQPLQDIRMMTATTGWAISWRINGPDSFELAHTVDGGCHWKNVTPVNHGSLFASHYAYISGTAAWLELVDGAGASQKVYFARTNDGGTTWKLAPSLDGDLSLSPTMGSAGITFLTPDIGWLLTSAHSGKANDNFTGVTLYHTVDGGLTWQKLAQSSATSAVSGGLPAASTYTGLSFINQSTGWITGTSSSSSDTWLYVTHDGGRSWQKQDLPLTRLRLAAASHVSAKDSIVTYPPQILSSRDALLTVTFTSTSWSSSLLYATHDGGTTWQPENFLPITPNTLNILSVAPLPSFISTGFGWLWTGAFYQPSNTLFVTYDAGQHWTPIKPSLPASTSVQEMQFVSSNVGWLLALSKASQSALFYQTIDGGKTWTQINYTVA